MAMTPDHTPSSRHLRRTPRPKEPEMSPVMSAAGESRLLEWTRDWMSRATLSVCVVHVLKLA